MSLGPTAEGVVGASPAGGLPKYWQPRVAVRRDKQAFEFEHVEVAEFGILLVVEIDVFERSPPIFI